MPLNTQLANASASAAADAVTALLNSGLLRIYDGTQPATADTAITTQTKLAELTFGNPAFGAAANGVATANAITSDTAADATGTASWARLVRSNGTTVVMDGSAGTSSSNLVLNTTSIVANAEVAVTSLTYTAVKAGS